MLKFVGDRSLVVKVADLILAGNEISVNVFDEVHSPMRSAKYYSLILFS